MKVFVSLFTPSYIVPFEVGQAWPEGEPVGQWLIEAIVDVDVPAGKYADCFRLQRSYPADSLIRWVCLGLGVVREEWHHYDQEVDYAAELTYSTSAP